MDSVSTHIINANFPHNEIRCGIGIDYGKMLVAKTGIIKKGKENTSNKSLVWFGRPANVASKLTDIANKKTSIKRRIVNECVYYPLTKKFVWTECEMNAFINKLKITHTPNLIHPDTYFSTLTVTDKTRETTQSPILMTESVYSGFLSACPKDKSIENGWWEIKNVTVSGCAEPIYGGNVIYITFRK